MSRAILYRVAGKPRPIRLDVTPGDDHAAAMRELLAADGELVDLTEDGVRFRLSWLWFDYVLRH